MNVVFTIQQILMGQPIYQDPSLPPYSITQYAPLYYYAAALPARLFGIAAGDVLAVSAVARGVSAAITAILALVCARFLDRRVGATKAVAFIAVVFILCATAKWYFAVRPDALATLFTILCFYVVAGGSSPRRVVIAAMLAVLAVFAKQTGVFAGITVVAFFTMRREWKALWIFAIAGLVGFIIATPVMLLTGPAIKANVIDGVNNGIAWRPALLLAYRPAFYWFAPLFALSFAAVPRLVRRNDSRPAQLIGVAIPISSALSMIAALKRGSAENYFNELVILSVFAFVAAYVRETKTWDRMIVGAFRGYVAALLLIRAGNQVYTIYLYHRASPETRLTSQIPAANYVRNHIDSGRYAIAFAVGLSNAFPERMILPEKALAPSAQQRHLVDYTHFSEDMRASRVQYAIVRNGEPLGPFLGESFERFRPVRKFEYYTVYELPPEN
jgi:hypothetical protein